MLNENQKKAVSFMDGPAMVLAGPGSGKTTVITRRILALIERGVHPENILVITFTKAAAMEMQGRFLKIGGPKGAGVSFGTFHSIFFHILRRQYKYGPEDILRHSLKEKILKDVLRRQRIRLLDEESLEELFFAISQVKNGKLNLESTSESEYEKSGIRPVSFKVFKKIYSEYMISMDSNGLLDFDDMVVKALELMRRDEKALSYWQERFKYILVDEFQDISPFQYEVVRLLAAPEDNLFIVGDDDQSIYGFRGSDPQIMLGFESDYPGAVRIDLDTNYRCSREITEGSVKVIENNKTRFNKTIISPKEASGPSILFAEYQDPASEADAVCRAVINEHKMNDVPYSEIAILYRNHSIAEVLRDKLLLEGIPVNIKEKPVNIYRGEVAKDVLSYIKIACGEGERADFLNVLNKPQRGLLRQAACDEHPSFDSMREYYEGDNAATDQINRWELLSRNMVNLTPKGAFSLIRHGLGYERYIREQGREGKKGSALIRDFERLLDEAGEFKTIRQYLGFYMQKISEEPKQENKDDGGENAERVSLYTLHGSKGLEFSIVFIIGMNEGVIPQNKEISSEVLEEERRLFYVGMTRAKEKLILSCARRRGGRELMPSRFLEEITGEYLHRQENQSTSRP